MSDWLISLVFFLFDSNLLQLWTWIAWMELLAMPPSAESGFFEFDNQLWFEQAPICTTFRCPTIPNFSWGHSLQEKKA